MVILIPVFCLLIWYNPFVQDQNLSSVEIAQMPLYSLLKSFIYTEFLLKLAGLIFILAIALYLNHLNTKFIFIAERTYLPSIIYIFIFCSLIYKRELIPAMPAALLFLMAMERLYDSYKTEKLSYNVFDAGLLLGIASLFYFNITYFILFIWISLLLIRKFYWREWVFSVLGFTIPYYLVFSYYYLFDHNVRVFLLTIRDNILLHNKLAFTTIQYASGAFLILIILLASQYIMNVYAAKKIFTRKSYSLFLVIFLIFIAALLSIPSASIELITIGAIPLSFLLSHYFIRTYRPRFVDIVFDIFVIVFIVSQVVRL